MTASFPIKVERRTPLIDVLAFMGDEHQDALPSYVVVMDGSKLVGTVTDWNIVQLISSGVSLHLLTIADVVEESPVTLSEQDANDLFMALSLMHQHRIDHLPVVDNDSNLLGLVTAAKIHQILKPSNLLKLKLVSDLITDKVAHANLNVSALRLAQLMTAYQTTSVIIVEDNSEHGLVPVGIVTAQDIVKLKHQGYALSQVLARSIMHAPLFCLSPSDSLWLAYEEMQQRQMQYLVVTDNQNRLLGVVTQMEMLHAMNPTQMHVSGHQLRQSFKQLQSGKLDLLKHHNSELERLVRTRTAQLEEQAKCDRLLATTTLRIHESPNLQEILNTTVSEVRQLLQTDRAIIYRLNPDDSGMVVVESVAPGWFPILGKTICESCFADQWRGTYQHGRVQAVEDIYKSGLSQCHIDLLSQFQVRAHLVLPILCEHKLWGLLAAQHCTQPRIWHNWEIQLLIQIVRQVGIAVHQSELHERVQIELKERRRVEEELSRLFNLSLDMVCVAGLDGYFKRLNPAFSHVLGYPESELLDKPFLDLVHPDDQQATLAMFEKLASGKPIDYFENRCRRHDGSYRWLAWTGVPDDPVKQLFYAIARDITEQKQAGIQLRQSKAELEAKVEERTTSWRYVNEQLLVEIAERNRADKDLRKAKDQLQAVLDAVPGLVSWIDSDLRYLGVNRHIATVFNQPIEAFIGQPIGFLNQSSQFVEFFKQFFAKPVATDSQEITVEIDGVCRDYLMVAQKYDHDRAAVSVGIDISDRKQIESALQHSEVKFRNLVEQTNDWVWEMDCNLRFTYLNPRVQDITGYESEELLSKRIFNFMPVDEAVRSETVLSYFLQKHEAFSQFEATFLHKNGHPVVLEISGSPVFTTQGKLQGYRGITRDITERKQVERDIRVALTKEKELNELKTRFISMASHEFRTPLTTILASSESLEHYQNKWTEDRKRSALQRIQTAAKHMTELLNDVLICGKGEAGKLEFHPAMLNLNQFCDELIEEFQFQEHNPQRLSFKQSGDITDAWVDEKLLRHILVNLLANALKYSSPETSVQLQLTHQDGVAIFQVQDAGIGIPANEQKRLFDSFYRATNVGNIPGTGLGLAIVMQAVKAHGGHVSVASEPGQGTTFTITLPIVK